MFLINMKGLCVIPLINKIKFYRHFAAGGILPVRVKNLVLFAKEKVYGLVVHLIFCFSP